MVDVGSEQHTRLSAGQRAENRRDMNESSLPALSVWNRVCPGLPRLREPRIQMTVTTPNPSFILLTTRVNNVKTSAHRHVECHLRRRHVTERLRPAFHRENEAFGGDGGQRSATNASLSPPLCAVDWCGSA